MRSETPVKAESIPYLHTPSLFPAGSLLSPQSPFLSATRCPQPHSSPGPRELPKCSWNRGHVHNRPQSWGAPNTPSAAHTMGSSPTQHHLCLVLWVLRLEGGRPRTPPPVITPEARRRGRTRVTRSRLPAIPVWPLKFTGHSFLWSEVRWTTAPLLLMTTHRPGPGVHATPCTPGAHTARAQPRPGPTCPTCPHAGGVFSEHPPTRLSYLKYPHEVSACPPMAYTLVTCSENSLKCHLCCSEHQPRVPPPHNTPGPGRSGRGL